jgi:hypothetical protein
VTGRNRSVGPTRTRTGAGPVLHVHLHTDALTGLLPAGEGAVGRASGLRQPEKGSTGPRAVADVERWIAGLRPGAVVQVTPVVDLNQHISVDAYGTYPHR